MRQFIVNGRDAPTDGDFSLDALPSAGRLDLLSRCVTASLLLSHGIRDDVRFWLVLADEYTVRFEGRELRQLHPDERSTAAHIRKALHQREEAIGHVEVELSPGMYLSRLGFEQTLTKASADGTVIELHGDGTPITHRDPPTDPIVVLSDHQNLPPKLAATLAEVREERLSLGPELLHADQAITVTHNWLDTKGFTTY